MPGTLEVPGTSKTQNPNSCAILRGNDLSLGTEERECESLPACPLAGICLLACPPTPPIPRPYDPTASFPTRGSRHPLAGLYPKIGGARAPPVVGTLGRPKGDCRIRGQISRSGGDNTDERSASRIDFRCLTDIGSLARQQCVFAVSVVTAEVARALILGHGSVPVLWPPRPERSGSD